MLGILTGFNFFSGKLPQTAHVSILVSLTCENRVIAIDDCRNNALDGLSGGGLRNQLCHITSPVGRLRRLYVPGESRDGDAGLVLIDGGK